MGRWLRGLLVVAALVLLFFGFWLPNAGGPGTDSPSSPAANAPTPTPEPLPTLATLDDDCGEELPPRLQPGIIAHVTRPDEGDGVVRGLRLRTRPGGPALRLLAPGDPITIDGESVCDGGRRWWPITSEEGVSGWAAEVDDEDAVYLITPGE